MVLNAAETFKKEMFYENISIIRNKPLWWWDSLFRKTKRGTIVKIKDGYKDNPNEIADWFYQNTKGNIHIMLGHIPRFGTAAGYSHFIPVIIQDKKDLMLVRLSFNFEKNQ